MNMIKRFIDKNKIFITLILIFLLGLSMRLIYFNRITFFYDQARDAFMAMDILTRDPIKIVGPNTDIFGLNHGVLYWYLIAPAYFLSSGNVYILKIFLILINLIGIFGIYFIGVSIFKNKFIGLFSAFIYAVSYESIQYAKWLSNPSMALVSSLFTIYSFWLFFKKDERGIFLFLIFWPISVQLEFFLVYLGPVFFIILLYVACIKKIKINWKKMILFTGISLIFFSTLIMEQVKYNFRGVKTLLGYLQQNRGMSANIIGNIYVFLEKIVSTFYFNIFGFNMHIAGFLVIAVLATCFYIVWNRKLLTKYKYPLIFSTFWLFIPLPLLPLINKSPRFVTLGSSYGAILLFSLFIFLIKEKIKYKRIFVSIFVIFILFGNLYLVFTQGNKGEYFFGQINNRLLINELNILDYIYKDSQGKQFAINTVTNPLLINTTWAYLFNWYGKSKYGYMPAWFGYPQVDVFGGNITMGKTDVNIEYGSLDKPVGKTLYLIMEPETGMRKEYFEAYKNYEDLRSKLVEKRNFANFVVEKRIFTKDMSFSIDEFFKILNHQ